MKKININLRPWQSEAREKCLKWFEEQNINKNFVINAAPGAGKTICASVIAQDLLEKEIINRVIIIAPRAEVVRQWSDEFKFITGRKIMKVTGTDLDIEDYGIDLCATWSSIQNLDIGFRKVCESYNTLVICDEHHHAAVSAAWGDSADSAFLKCKFSIILTGTPIRSDGKETVWLAFDDKGEINHPESGTYTLSYGESVDLGYCRPVTFHRHEGNFSVKVGGETIADVTSSNVQKIAKPLRSLKGLQRATDYYKLACMPQYNDDETPNLHSYQASMIKWGINKLDETRNVVPDAGGLIIAPNIEVAKYMCDIIEILEKEKPSLVHSKINNADKLIESFRHSKKRWMVSVAMVSEGVDIKRLRVLIYLPNAQTELFFRQAIGRVVRSLGDEDHSRAYVIMPSHKIFDKFARSVEKEMNLVKPRETGETNKKICPVCENECNPFAKTCDECGHEFKIPNKQYLICSKCGTQNELDSTVCKECGESLKTEFTIHLNRAEREGAIVRGMQLNEKEVSIAEKFGPSLRADILSSGDEVLIEMFKRLPDEATSRLVQLCSKHENIN